MNCAGCLSFACVDGVSMADLLVVLYRHMLLPRKICVGKKARSGSAKRQKLKGRALQLCTKRHVETVMELRETRHGLPKKKVEGIQYVCPHCNCHIALGEEDTDKLFVSYGQRCIRSRLCILLGLTSGLSSTVVSQQLHVHSNEMGCWANWWKELLAVAQTRLEGYWASNKQFASDRI